MIHNIGERIGKYRKELNMSQEELATALNVSRQTISKWETGNTLPDVYNAVALANLFHVSLDGFIMGSQSKLGGSSYMMQLKDKRHKINKWAIIVGAIGSTSFAVPIVLLKALNFHEQTGGIIFAFVLPFLMLCWGYAIWGFIKVGRVNDEIKYLQQIELENLRNKE